MKVSESNIYRTMLIALHKVTEAKHKLDMEKARVAWLGAVDDETLQAQRALLPRLALDYEAAKSTFDLFMELHGEDLEGLETAVERVFVPETTALHPDDLSFSTVWVGSMMEGKPHCFTTAVVKGSVAHPRRGDGYCAWLIGHETFRMKCAALDVAFCGQDQTLWDQLSYEDEIMAQRAKEVHNHYAKLNPSSSMPMRHMAMVVMSWFGVLPPVGPVCVALEETCQGGDW